MSDESVLTETEALSSLSSQAQTRLASIFRLLGEEGRLKMVLACLSGPKPVCCLATAAGLSQSLASHHLRHLREARILKATRQGKNMLYTLDDQHIESVLHDMVSHVLEPEHSHCSGA